MRQHVASSSGHIMNQDLPTGGFRTLHTSNGGSWKGKMYGLNLLNMKWPIRSPDLRSQSNRAMVPNRKIVKPKRFSSRYTRFLLVSFYQVLVVLVSLCFQCLICTCLGHRMPLDFGPPLTSLDPTGVAPVRHEQLRRPAAGLVEPSGQRRPPGGSAQRRRWY